MTPRPAPWQTPHRRACDAPRRPPLAPVGGRPRPPRRRGGVPRAPRRAVWLVPPTRAGGRRALRAPASAAAGGDRGECAGGGGGGGGRSGRRSPDRGRRLLAQRAWTPQTGYTGAGKESDILVFAEDPRTLHIAKLSEKSFNGSLPGFSALLVMTFYLVLVTDTVTCTQLLDLRAAICFVIFSIQVDKDR